MVHCDSIHNLKYICCRLNCQNVFNNLSPRSHIKNWSEMSIFKHGTPAGSMCMNCSMLGKLSILQAWVGLQLQTNKVIKFDNLRTKFFYRNSDFRFGIRDLENIQKRYCLIFPTLFWLCQIFGCFQRTQKCPESAVFGSIVCYLWPPCHIYSIDV